MLATEKFDEAVSAIAPRISRVLSFLPDEIKRRTEEVRLRNDLPVSLTICGKSCFVTKRGNICDYLNGDLLSVSAQELYDSFLLLCRHSVYDHAAELREGYIQAASGNRVGVCGRFGENGALSEITSLNLRIAHEVIGCADSLLCRVRGGMLIAGPPCCGKTTILRDLVRGLSETGKRVAVVDSRGEISGGGRNRLGANTDVIKISDKAVGVEIALRTLFPNIIAFDEIGTENELNGVSESFCAGVSIITTAHAGSIQELSRRRVTSLLIRSGAVSDVVMLPENIGGKPLIYDVAEMIR